MLLSVQQKLISKAISYPLMVFKGDCSEKFTKSVLSLKKIAMNFTAAKPFNCCLVGQVRHHVFLTKIHRNDDG